MKKKEKKIAAAGTIAGAIAGTILGAWLMGLDGKNTAALFAALIMIAYLAARTILIILEVKRESRGSRTYPANWGFDKRFE